MRGHKEASGEVIGIGDEALNIWNRKLLIGRNFSLLEIDQKSGVCIIGNEIAQRLFSDSQPLGQVVSVSQNSNSFGCRIIGVLKKSISNKEFIKPNLQIYVPFKYFQAIIGDWWSSEIKEVLIQLSMNSDVERFGKKIKSFFEQKYSPSGKFTVDSDNVLIAQMRKFLSIFNILLSTIAFVTLLVGGMGITNMMLVSVSERFREIGLRKAMGATSLQIRTQFLVESMIVCVISGIIGLILGFACYQLAIFAATKLVSKLHYEWILSLNALFLSLCSIVMVGILSGIFPALKAEKLQVIDALRSE